MSAATLDDSPISYEQLQDIEDDFEQVELELLRQGEKLTKDLFVKRAKILAQIPNFWPLVFEQAPPEIDEYIQPTDSALLLSALTGLSVDRFELASGGDPRSLAITFTFSENEHFSNTTLEKKFWWRHAKDGWEGLVSEPVSIDWKSPDKDLTQGMLALVTKVQQENVEEDTPAKKELKALMDKTGLGGVSFFAWFGFVGRNVSAAESVEAFKEAQAKRKARKEGKETDAMEEDEEDDDDEDEYEMEIFPTADDLAICIAEDLWPNAIKYFIEAQEMDGMSDVDFETDDEMDQDEEDEEKPSKKRKA